MKTFASQGEGQIQFQYFPVVIIASFCFCCFDASKAQHLSAMPVCAFAARFYVILPFWKKNGSQ